MLFGVKSEKLTSELEQLEPRLEELETNEAAEEAAQDAARTTQPAGRPRRRPRRKPLPEDLPREVVTHLPGGALRQFGEDVSEQLERIPATFKVIRHVRPKFACNHCEPVVEASAPSRPIERGLAGPGLLAHVPMSKYGHHLPLYRQAEICAREGVDLLRVQQGQVSAASSEPPRTDSPHNPERNASDVRLNARACDSGQHPKLEFSVHGIPADDARVSLSYHSGL